MSLSFDRSAALVAENAKYVAGGVNSNFRTGMAGGPLVFQRGEGPYLIDADNNRLIDYYCGMGAMVPERRAGDAVIGSPNAGFATMSGPCWPSRATCIRSRSRPLVRYVQR